MGISSNFAGFELMENLPLPRLSPLLSVEEKSWAAGQRSRRSRILATARQLLCEDEPGDISMKLIADRCDLAVQTIYNIIGSKIEVFNQAICEEISQIGQYTRMCDSYPDRIVALSDLSFFYVLKSPRYIMNVIRLSSPLDGEIHQSLQKCVVRNFVEILSEDRNRDTDRYGFDVEKFSINLHYVIVAAIMEWAGGHCQLHDLRLEMAARARHLTLGSVGSDALHWLAAPRRCDALSAM
jgi:AcrR family transcriptional regulator